MKFIRKFKAKNYLHVGYSYPSVPKPWKPIVERAIVKIEKEMWPQWWLPMFVKRWIHWLATGNSVVRVKYRWANKLRDYLTGGQMIHQIKDKYATLRIYVHANQKIYDIIKEAEDECIATCENCGSKEDVQEFSTGWVYNICALCRKKLIDEFSER